ncbi:hypothetical protein NT6N_27610 [Oceaniferula spumae]|uniref:Ice-binding protein C-terminal domain-containing protein n=1 Tax=Oceaniferula spumae TaxID=2979115 RepID=A0AAT9FNX2_9BACT
MNKHFSSILIASSLVVASSQAATISWASELYTNTTTSITNDTLGTGQFDQSGDFVFAENSAGAALTFDGIAFAANGTTGNLTYNNIPNSGAFAHTVSNGLSHTARFTPAASLGPATGVTLSGLFPGTVYRVQFLLMDGRTNANHGGGTRSVLFDNVQDAFGTVSATEFAAGQFTNGNPTTANSDYGSALLVTGVFTADVSGTQVIGIDAVNDGTNSSAGGQLNAITLYEVPEPSSAALLGLGGLALILRRRK